MRDAKLEIKYLKQNMSRIEELQKKKELSREEKAELLDLRFYVKTLLTAFEILTEEEYEIVRLRVEKVRIADIGIMKGFSHTGICHKLDRIYKKLEKLL